ncbi:tripartite tricarboxylate transporter TctB family protein [Paracoccus caeni]|uniref:tripartite tricarboxylate transporter TctB family protein n=1 Tax=Paracoccus caeni TaxID=657651 RepID=UPI001F36701C|nr:tripartite tricarboxylate transporter TctB family protein [Paracoccus caeni]
MLLAIGAFFGLQTMGLEIGTSLRMGPGYFPMMLTILLLILGVAVLISAFKTKAGEPIGPIAWRGMLLILPAPVFFGLTVKGLGFVPALFFTALIAAGASIKMKPLTALILAVIVTIASTLIFSYGLGLPFRRFGPWLPQF